MPMTAKEYLSQYSLLILKIKQRQQELECLLYYLNWKYPADKAVIKRLIRKVERAIKYLSNRQNTIFDQVQGIADDRYRQLLFLRFIEGKDLLHISEEMSYSEQYIRRLHGKALEAFTQRYFSET